MSAARLYPDLCIVGGFGGGLHLAFQAAALGAKVVLVEPGPLEHILKFNPYLHLKAISSAGKVAILPKYAKNFGITLARPRTLDLKKIKVKAGEIPAFFVSDITKDKLPFQWIKAQGSFKSAKIVQAGDVEVKAAKRVIFFPPRPQVPNIEGLEKSGYLDFTTFKNFAPTIKSLMILGADRFAVAAAQACQNLNIKATLVVDANGLLPDFDPQVVNLLKGRLMEDGVTLIEGASPLSVEKKSKKVILNYEDITGKESKVTADQLLISQGVAVDPSVYKIKNIGLGDAPFAPDKQLRLRSKPPHIYMAGLNGVLEDPLAIDATVRHLLSVTTVRLPTLHTPPITQAVFTDPEVVQVGLSEAAARAKYKDIHITSTQMAPLPGALSDRDGLGLVKVITIRNGYIVGASLAGPRVSDLAAVMELAIQRKIKLKKFLTLSTSYPAYSMVFSMLAELYMAQRRRLPWGRYLFKFIKLFN